MLVLSRKLGETLRLGDDIRITIVRIDRHSVRIGIEAPATMSICRQELTVYDPSDRPREYKPHAA